MHPNGLEAIIREADQVFQLPEGIPEQPEIYISLCQGLRSKWQPRGLPLFYLEPAMYDITGTSPQILAGTS